MRQALIAHARVLHSLLLTLAAVFFPALHTFVSAELRRTQIMTVFQYKQKNDKLFFPTPGNNKWL